MLDQPDDLLTISHESGMNPFYEEDQILFETGGDYTLENNRYQELHKVHREYVNHCYL